MSQLTLFEQAGGQPEMAVTADTASNGGKDPEAQPGAAVLDTNLPTGNWFMYHVAKPEEIPDAISMFTNRFGIPFRLLVWPGCDFEAGIPTEVSQLVNKGLVWMQ